MLPKKPTGFNMPFAEITTPSFDSPSSLQPSLSHEDVAWMSETLFADNLPSTPCLQDLLENDFFSVPLSTEVTPANLPGFGSLGSRSTPQMESTHTPEYGNMGSLKTPQMEDTANVLGFGSLGSRSTPQMESTHTPEYGNTGSLGTVKLEGNIGPMSTPQTEGTHTTLGYGKSEYLNTLQREATSTTVLNIFKTYTNLDVKSHERPSTPAPQSPPTFNATCSPTSMVCPSPTSPLSYGGSPAGTYVGDVDDEGSHGSASTMYPAKLPLPVVEADPPSLLVMRDACSPANESHTMPLVDFPTFTECDFEAALKQKGYLKLEGPGTCNVKEKLKKTIRVKRKSQGLDEEPEVPAKAKCNQLTSDDIERYERRKLSNRKAANKQRQKKKDEAARLEMEKKEIERQNAELQGEVTTLKREVADLSDALNTHRRVCRLDPLDPQYH